jgi:hypothetical protein
VTELLRELDRLQSALQGAAAQGDPRAIEISLKIMARRAKILGIGSVISSP